MIVYRGDAMDNFKIEKWKYSRYGFRALFFASEISLARLYAIHRANEEQKTTGGFVYQFEITQHYHTVNYGGNMSYSSDFRNLIITLQKQGRKAALIKNVYDYPSQKLLIRNTSDVIVVFDFSIIKSYTLLESNVRTL